MKLGLKLFPDASKEYIDEFKDDIDFLEIYARVGEEYDFVSGVKKPIIVHTAHSGDRINFLDQGKQDKNLEAMNWAKKLADKFGSDKIIFHPEMVENSKCTITHLQDFIKENYDKRLVIENMPFSDKMEFLYYDPESLKTIIKDFNLGFCLDFNHASEAAYRLDIDFEKFFKMMLELNPIHFHVSDSNWKNNKEDHHNFFDGKLDLELVRRLIPKDAWVTIETPHDIKKQKKEIEFLKRQNPVD